MKTKRRGSEPTEWPGTFFRGRAVFSAHAPVAFPTGRRSSTQSASPRRHADITHPVRSQLAGVFDRCGEAFVLQQAHSSVLNRVSDNASYLDSATACLSHQPQRHLHRRRDRRQRIIASTGLSDQDFLVGIQLAQGGGPRHSEPWHHSTLPREGLPDRANFDNSGSSTPGELMLAAVKRADGRLLAEIASFTHTRIRR
jgi:hypothetical protein